MRYTPAVLAFFLPLFLGACVTTPKHQPAEKPTVEVIVEPIPATTPVISQEGILEYIGKFLALPASGQREELAKLHARLNMNNQDLNDRTKAAAIYALSDVSDIRDASKAQVLLDELSRENDPEIERTTLVRILRGSMLEHSRITRENNRLTQKIAEEQKRTEALQFKLEELKNIERNIVDRKVMDK